jgi:hypothetical protein
MWRFSGASTMSLMLATSMGESWVGLVLGHEERSSKPQTAVEARFHRWYRPGVVVHGHSPTENSDI